MRRYYRKDTDDDRPLLAVTSDNNTRTRLRARGWTAWDTHKRSMTRDQYRTLLTMNVGYYEMIGGGWHRLDTDLSRA